MEASDLLIRGFRRGDHAAVERLVVEQGQFLERERAEDDPSFKQIIPYAVVRHGEAIFLLRRLARGGEKRLHDRLSIGVGGHVNRECDEPSGWIRAGLERELSEEIRGGGRLDIRALGLLNDDSDEVGRVHFGLVYSVEVSSPDVEVRETDRLEGEFVNLDHLESRLDDMESWSRWITRDLLPRSGAGQRKVV